jgi:hypothetical protein
MFLVDKVCGVDLVSPARNKNQPGMGKQNNLTCSYSNSIPPDSSHTYHGSPDSGTFQQDMVLGTSFQSDSNDQLDKRAR